MNRCVLTACITEQLPIRYTPAGLPALDVRLEHESMVMEAGQERRVSAKLKALAFGAEAERLAMQPIGSRWCFKGFLASPRHGNSLVLHIQEFSQD